MAGLSGNPESFRVHDVTLSASDDFGTNRDKFARVMLDAMYDSSDGSDDSKN